MGMSKKPTPTNFQPLKMKTV